MATTSQLPSLYGLTRDALGAHLEAFGMPRFRAAQLYRWIYRRHVRDAAAMTNLPASMRGRLGEWWGADLGGVTPDVLLSGKILGGGVMPVGGVVATAEMFAPLNADPLLHSSTFAGS